MATFEQQYEDVLQNIEFSIIGVYREHPEMTDWSMDAAVEALARAYAAEAGGRTPPRARLDALEQEVFDRVRAVCEWRLGRDKMVGEGGEQNAIMKDMTSKTLDEIIACLKRIRTSIKRWTKERGRQGYLSFVAQFIH